MALPNRSMLRQMEARMWAEPEPTRNRLPTVLAALLVAAALACLLFSAIAAGNQGGRCYYRDAAACEAASRSDAQVVQFWFVPGMVAALGTVPLFLWAWKVRQAFPATLAAWGQRRGALLREARGLLPPGTPVADLSPP
jgi:hypothetical protein